MSFGLDRVAAPLDSARRTARAAFATHGWTALFVAVTFVLARVEGASFALTKFHGRTMGWATADGFDINGRARLFATSIVLFVVLFALTLVALDSVRKRLLDGALDLLEPLSIAGLALWGARAYTVPVWTPINLVLGLQFAVLGLAVIDRVLFRSTVRADRAAYMASLAVLAFGLVSVYDDFCADDTRTAWRWFDWGTGLLVVPLHLVLRASTWRRDPDRRGRMEDALLAAAPWAALLPLTSILREEVYLALNARGYLDFTPNGVQIAVLALLASLATMSAVRAWRRSSSAGASTAGTTGEPGAGGGSGASTRVARWTFPLLAAVVIARVQYRPWLELSNDLFEPANAGLMIQQWIDFGRVPLLETFGAHGLSETVWGFLYRAVEGTRDEAFEYYAFLGASLTHVVLYAVLLVSTRSAYLALFCVFVFPFTGELFPPYAQFALIVPLVILRLARRPTRRAWLGLGVLHLMLFLWRLDLGFAAALASAATLLSLRVLQPGFRFRWRDLAWAAAWCVGGAASLFLGACWWRGVAPIPRIVDFLHIVDSSQGFGASVLSTRIDPLFLWHHFVFPLLMLGSAAWILARFAGRLTIAEPRRAVVVVLVFAVAYVFANFQRGLVRHTFLEMGNVYLSSFTLGVLALLWFTARDLAPRTAAVGFLATATVLAGSFGLQGDLPEHAGAFASDIVRLEAHLRAYPRVLPSNGIVDRSPIWPKQVEKHFGAFTEFTARVLRPDETFLDLSNDPVLYERTHRRSPHYLNHLFLAHDEWLVRRSIEEFERNAIPFVVVTTESDLARRDGAIAFNSMDGVPNSYRHYRFREWLYERYEPLCIVQRWQVWGRKGWTMPLAPLGTDERVLWSWKGTGTPGVREIEADAADFAAGARERADGAVELSPDRPAYMRLVGRAARDTKVGATLTFADGTVLSRTLVVRASSALAPSPGVEDERTWCVPAEVHPRRLARIRLEFGPSDGFLVTRVELLDHVAPAYSEITERARAGETIQARRIPWLWANGDEGEPLDRPVLRELGPVTRGSDAGTLLHAGMVDARIDPRTNAVFENGIHKTRAGFLLAVTDEALLPVVGEKVTFAASGVRVVEWTNGLKVFVDGPPLDPVLDGPPHVVRFGARSSALRALSEEQIVRYEFEPLRESERDACALVLHIESVSRESANEPVQAWVDWGADGAALGRFTFDLVGAGPQDYLVRLSSQYGWFREPARWIRLAVVGGSARVERARLVAGD